MRSSGIYLRAISHEMLMISILDIDLKIINSRKHPKGYKFHDDIIKWKHFRRYWPFMRGIHRSQVNSPYKGQWRGALMSSLICPWINSWVNNGEAGDLGRHRAHYDVTAMLIRSLNAFHKVSIMRYLSWLSSWSGLFIAYKHTPK